MSDTEQRRHFAPYGSTNALCDETVPRAVHVAPAIGEYADDRFTVMQDRTTCPECLWRMAGTHRDGDELARAVERGDELTEVERLSIVLAVKDAQIGRLVAQLDAVRDEERERIVADLIGPAADLAASIQAFKAGWHDADMRGLVGARVASGLRHVVNARIRAQGKEQGVKVNTRDAGTCECGEPVEQVEGEKGDDRG